MPLKRGKHVLSSKGNDAFTAFLVQVDRETLSMRKTARLLGWIPIALTGVLAIGAAQGWFGSESDSVAVTLAVCVCLPLWFLLQHFAQRQINHGLSEMAACFVELYPHFADSYAAALKHLATSATGSGVEIELMARLPAPDDIRDDGPGTAET
jgi:hypothetical protein